MKKVVVFLVLLLALSVHGAVLYGSTYPPAPAGTVARIADFPLDNIHILRLQEASASLGRNVSEIQTKFDDFLVQQKQSQDAQSQALMAQKNDFAAFQRDVLTHLGSLQTAQNSQKQPEIQYPAGIAIPSSLFVLLGLNIFLLIVVIVLIFWLREQYLVHTQTPHEEHIHLAPPELIAHITRELAVKKLPQIRMELVAKGWTPSVIEHAVHAARDR